MHLRENNFSTNSHTVDSKCGRSHNLHFMHMHKCFCREKFPRAVRTIFIQMSRSLFVFITHCLPTWDYTVCSASGTEKNQWTQAAQKRVSGWDESERETRVMRMRQLLARIVINFNESETRARTRWGGERVTQNITPTGICAPAHSHTRKYVSRASERTLCILRLLLWYVALF